MTSKKSYSIKAKKEEGQLSYYKNRQDNFAKESQYKSIITTDCELSFHLIYENTIFNETDRDQNTEYRL